MKRRALSRPVAVPALTALLLAMLWVFLPASPAWAHAQLLDSSPAADTEVAKTPTAVTLTFDSPISQEYTTVVVAGLDGTSYSDGAATVTGTDVRQKVSALPGGRIQVTWRTIAADGAPMQGRYTFTNTDKTAPAQPTPASPPATETSPASAPPVTSTDTGAGTGTDTGTGTDDAPDWPWWAAAGALVVATITLLVIGLRRSAAAPGAPHGENGDSSDRPQP
ncbi:copper resistance protein CopC [Streptomyces sp. RY43-2]|uniref:Copper resistance protein CopC n=1 Tax=Streptomyces macrolidinus TaxID=2952607 RepID=A0ABT0ZJP1_9ACTN|nr:copper resistance CopC family protein [Streptomyces macrolidinus]MCN9243809.1 copper resistance protein CopC [Streptomyces macrolidinus]